MKMEKSSDDQMGCSMCFLVAVLAIPLLIFAGFWGFGFLSILLTSSVLIFSTIVLSSFKNKAQLVESEEEVHMEHIVESKPQPESEAQESEVGDEFLVRSATDTSSESESCLDHSSTSEDSEADHSPDWSDGSISDEESLIEIALPSGHYVGHNYKKEEPKYMNLQPRMLQDFLPKSIFQQQSLMELLAEINEMNELEDNLIEIDISMGSIKCSRIEIEA